MGFNLMDKMKSAAISQLDNAKNAVVNKATELKDTAVEKTKEGLQTAGKATGKAIKKGASEAWDVLKNGPKPVETPHIITADDFTGDLTCPVCVYLIDAYDQIYANEEPLEDDYVDDSEKSDSTDRKPDYSNYHKSDCCAECGTPFVVAGSYYDYIIESWDIAQNKQINSDLELLNKQFCCIECAEKCFINRFPGVFITQDRNQYEARLMAGRKKTGNVTFGDKLANKFVEQTKQTMEQNNKILQKNREEKASKNKFGLLGFFFPFLKKL